MPRKKTPPLDDPATPPAPEPKPAPQPKRPRASRAAAGKTAKAPAKPHPASLTTDADRAAMGAAIVPIVDRNGPLLLALARKSFPSAADPDVPDLTPPEERFFRNLGIVVFGDELPDEKDAAKTLRADRLAWALLDRCALRLLTPQGVMVKGANITGRLELSNCQSGLCLQLDACRFDENIALEDAQVTVLSLEGSQCRGLDADGMQVRGGVFLRNKAVFTGEVRLLGAKIGGNLECDESTFSNENGMALYADSIAVQGSVFLRGGCTISGHTDFTNAQIQGWLVCTTLGKDTVWSLRLSHARVGMFWDDRESWPVAGKLWLDGFHYDRLYEKAVWDRDARLDWLLRHKNAGAFNPQPYEQLARVYREAGHEANARDVLIAKNKRRLEERRSCLPSLRELAKTWPGIPRSKPSVLPWLFTTFPVWLSKARGPCRSVAGYWLFWLFGKICAFGYKPWRAAGWWMGLWAVTWLTVSLMAAGKWLAPTLVDMGAESLKPIGFTSSGFSFDLLTPIFDMGYLSAWTPTNNCAALILLVLGTFGYILVALYAASITGLIRK